MKLHLRAILQNNVKTLYILTANTLSSLFQWLVICTMTKIFNEDAVGTYSSIMAIIVPIITFGNLSLRAVQISDVEKKFQLNDILCLKIISSALSITIISASFAVKGMSIDTLLISVTVLICKLCTMFSDTVYGRLIFNGNFKKYAISLSSVAVFSFLFFFVAALATKNLMVSMVFYAIPYILVLLSYDFKNIDAYAYLKHLTFNFSNVKVLFLFCIPLAIVSTVNTLYDSIPKLMIEEMISVEQLGIYSATSYISLVGGLVVGAVTLSYATNLAYYLKNNNREKFMKIILMQEGLMLALCLCIIVALVLFGKELVTLVYTEKYTQYMDVIILLVVSMSLRFGASILGTACTAAHINRSQLMVAIVCVSFLAVICRVLIPVYGIKGAAISLILTYLIKMILLFFLLVYFIFLQPHKKRNGIRTL